MLFFVWSYIMIVRDTSTKDVVDLKGSFGWIYNFMFNMFICILWMNTYFEILRYVDPMLDIIYTFFFVYLLYV